MNKIYLVDFDNGYDYSDNETYTCVVFDSYDKAKKYCLEKGYKETETKGYFKEMCDFENKYFGIKSLEIVEVEMNKEVREI